VVHADSVVDDVDEGLVFEFGHVAADGYGAGVALVGFDSVVDEFAQGRDKLLGVDADVRQIRSQVGHELDVLFIGVFRAVGEGLVDEVGEVCVLGLWRGRFGELHQLRHYVRDFASGFSDGGESGLGVSVGLGRGEQFGAADEDGERVVDFVGGAAGHFTDGGHAAFLDEFVLRIVEGAVGLCELFAEE